MVMLRCSSGLVFFGPDPMTRWVTVPDRTRGKQHHLLQ